MTDEGERSRSGSADTAGEARLRTSAALRTLTALVVARPIEEEPLAECARELEALAERLTAAAGPGRVVRVPPGREARVRDFLPTSPVLGEGNPIAPPADVWSVTVAGGPRELRGRVTFSPVYEGAPGLVHGGVIAMLGDDMLGAANMMAGHFAATATLTVRYRKPVPVETPLDLEARLVGLEGRRLRTWGGIFNDGALMAEVEGIFVAMTAQRMLHMSGDHPPVA